MEEFDINKAREEMKELLIYKMPFGQYKDRKVIELPEHYLLWFKRKGFPQGKLGRYMEIALEMKINGLQF